METCATLITHVHALCTHTPPLPPASITLCLRSVLGFFLDDHIPGSVVTILPSHVLSFTCDVTGVTMSCVLFSKHWLMVSRPQIALSISFLPLNYRRCHFSCSLPLVRRGCRNGRVDGQCLQRAFKLSFQT